MPFFFTSYFWEFFFDNKTQHHFYEAAVWGNVVAILPLAIVGLIAFIWHKGVVEETHRKLDVLTQRHNEHAEHLKRILDVLDPETDGGITLLHESIKHIEDEIDLKTPGGLRTVLDEIKRKNKS